MKGLEGYEEVADRIKRFYDKHPDGVIRTRSWRVVEVAGQSFIAVESMVCRSPEDSLPGYGNAWCQFPGRTGFTRGSELMNAETASWGRALASIGFGGKRIASSDEVAQVAVKSVDESLSAAATDLIAFVAQHKVPADKIKLCLGAMGVAVGNKRLKTVLAGMSDEQVAVLKGKLS